MTELPARQPVVFELDRLSEYSDDAILDELRRVADIAPVGPLTTRLFQRHSRVSSGTVTRRFGSWDNALSSAGLNDRWLGSRAAKVAATKSITNEDILKALAVLARHLGKTELTWRDANGHLPFRAEILKKRWESVRAAFEAAGLSSTRRGHRYSDEDCFDNMLTLWTFHGRPPRYREMSESTSKIGATPYLKRFGTWKKALTAFVQRVNSDLEILDSDTTTESASPVVERLSTAIDEGRKDKRNISLGVRFQVLRQDRFRCAMRRQPLVQSHLHPPR